MSAHYGPMRADWTVYKNGGTKELDRPLVSCGSSEGAQSDAAYYRRECGYDVYIERAEFCPAPGCDGWSNTRKVPGRRGMYRDVACLNHRGVYYTRED